MGDDYEHLPIWYGDRWACGCGWSCDGAEKAADGRAVEHYMRNATAYRVSTSQVVDPEGPVDLWTPIEALIGPMED